MSAARMHADKVAAGQNANGPQGLDDDSAVGLDLAAEPGSKPRA